MNDQWRRANRGDPRCRVELILQQPAHGDPRIVVGGDVAHGRRQRFQHHRRDRPASVGQVGSDGDGDSAAERFAVEYGFLGTDPGRLQERQGGASKEPSFTGLPRIAAEPTVLHQQDAEPTLQERPDAASAIADVAGVAVQVEDRGPTRSGRPVPSQGDPDHRRFAAGPWTSRTPLSTGSVPCGREIEQLPLQRVGRTAT